MKINSIKKGKGNKYIIKGDYDIELYDEVILNHNLLFKKELTDKEINEYLKENYKYEVLNKIIKFIKRKVRCTKEINDELKKYELNDKDKNIILDKLKNMGLLNDDNFLESYVYDKFYLTNDGPLKIQSELLKYHINEDKIIKRLSLINDDEIIDKLTKIVNKKIKMNHKYSKVEFMNREVINLVNLGYQKEMIIDIINVNYIDDDSEKLVKEFDKLYKKYVNKYDSNKLKYFIRQKLYSKGYQIDDINKILYEKNI